MDIEGHLCIWQNSAVWTSLIYDVKNNFSVKILELIYNQNDIAGTCPQSRDGYNISFILYNHMLQEGATNDLPCLETWPKTSSQRQDKKNIFIYSSNTS